MFGVYDGHGGWRVADFVGRHLHNVVDDCLPPSAADDAAVGAAVKKAFLDMDSRVLSGVKADHTGATGTTCNVLSHDHKPDSPRESARIKAAGSTVSSDCRVEGLLAVRGPPEGQAVTADPDQGWV
eukprot:gene969-33899_t